VPTDLDPPLGTSYRAALGYPPSECIQAIPAHSVPACVFGDLTGRRTVVLYGDSHAGMWFDALDGIAKSDGWKLVVLFKESCPASTVPVLYLRTEFASCDRWHASVIKRIDALDPDVLVISQQVYMSPRNARYAPKAWTDALASLLRTVHARRKVVIGDIPGTGGPGCVSSDPNDVGACAVPVEAELYAPYVEAERVAAREAGATYISTWPWFCTTVCPVVIGHYDVYADPTHVSGAYAGFLREVLAQKLNL